MDITQPPQTRFMSRNFNHLFVFDITVDNHEIQKIFKVFLVIVKLVIQNARQNLHEFDNKIWGRGVERNWGDGD